MPLRPEDQFQIAAHKFLRPVVAQDVVWSGIEHAQKLSLVAAGVRKAKGVKPGLADFMFWHASKFVAIELKWGDGRQSDEQKGFATSIRAAGFLYFVCRSIADIARALMESGIPTSCTLLQAEIADMRLVAAMARKSAPKRPAARKPRERVTAAQVARAEAWRDLGRGR